MIRIDIADPVAKPKEVMFKGKALTFFEQEAWAWLYSRSGSLDPHPTKITLSHEKESAVLPKGSYQLAPESIYCGQYGQLQLGRVKVKPLAVAGAIKAA